MTERHENSDELIPLVEAAQYSGLTHDFLRELARKGKLHERKVGRDWLTTPAAVDQYFQGRSPVGRKPKNHKKRLDKTPLACYYELGQQNDNRLRM